MTTESSSLIYARYRRALCRLGFHAGELEPARNKTRRIQMWESYCRRCDKRLA